MNLRVATSQGCQGQVILVGQGTSMALEENFFFLKCRTFQIWSELINPVIMIFCGVENKPGESR